MVSIFYVLAIVVVIAAALLRSRSDELGETMDDAVFLRRMRKKDRPNPLYQNKKKPHRN